MSAVSVTARPLPGPARVAAARVVVELKSFFRDRQAVVFTFLFPVLMLTLFASVFSGRIPGTNVDFRQYFIAGVMATGIMSVSFSSLAIGLAIENGDGTLKRLAGTPMPAAAYFAGKLGMVLVAGMAEIVIQLLLGTVLFGLDLPAGGGRWLTLAGVFLLGSASCALLGMAYSRLIRSPKAAAAVVTPPFIALQFISGIFFPFSQAPDFIQAIAGVFPLKWIAQGLRSVFLPDDFAFAEPAASWEHGRTLLVLTAWAVASGVVAVLAFRRREQ
jgi:ABC-2 type transport system permease protein